MLWRILLALAKSLTLVALFGFINRIAVPTGLQIALIDPVATAASRLSGLPSSYSSIVIVAAVALVLLRVLVAVARAATATIRH